MKCLYTDTPHNVNNVQMGDDEMPSKGKKVSSVQHKRQKLFWCHICSSSNIKLQHPCKSLVVKDMTPAC